MCHAEGLPVHDGRSVLEYCPYDKKCSFAPQVMKWSDLVRSLRLLATEYLYSEYLESVVLGVYEGGQYARRNFV